MGVVMLEVRNVTGSRSEIQLFRELSFDLQPQQLIYVRGRNGTGKTTLLRTLCGLVRADSGDILWNNVGISDCQPEYFRALTYIGHENGIKGDLTALENLHFHQRLHNSSSRHTPSQALEVLGVSSLAHIPCRYLSAGQKRRIALARLLISSTELWLLDEPFTALDDVAREVVSQIIDDHLQSNGMCIATSHQPSDFERFNVTEITLGDLS